MVIETDDVDAQRQALSGWDQDYAQLSAGEFHGRTTSVNLGGVRLFREQLSARVEQLFVPPPGIVAFSLHLGADAPSRVAGVEAGAQSFCVLPGGRECHVVTDRDSDILCIEMEEDAFPESDALRGRRNRVLSAPEAPQVAWWLASVLANYTTVQTAASGDDDMGVLADLVVSRCRRLLRDGGDGVRDRRVARYDLVRRAREIALGALPEVLEVGEIAERLRVSGRLLEDCFRDVVGMGAASWLRVQRLNRAHRDLRMADPESTVAEVATRWGFWHLGRFSGYYRDLFGCSPSETLRG